LHGAGLIFKRADANRPTFDEGTRYSFCPSIRLYVVKMYMYGCSSCTL